MFLVVSYDISSDERRNKVARVLKNFGQRVQYSVFECQLKQGHFARMIQSLEGLIDEGDSLRIYQLCELCVKKGNYLGKGKMFKEEEVFIV